MFGVPWAINDAGPMPDTTKPPLESMADWRDVVKLPDLDALIPFGIYEEFLKPYYKRMVDKIKGFGKKVEFHMCGKVEPFIMDLAEMGVPVVSAFILDGINDQDAFALSASPLSLNYA